jgi:hypothetical protein
MYVNITIIITELIIFSIVLLMKKFGGGGGGLKGVWILQEGIYEGTETCRKVLYVCVFSSLRQNEEKKNYCLETTVNNP